MQIQPLSFAERLAGAVAAIVVGVAAALVLFLILPREARAARFDCHDFAMVAGSAADFRDAGAQLDLTLVIARDRSKDRTQAELALIEREIRRVFREKKNRRRVVAETYRRCRDTRGSMD